MSATDVARREQLATTGGRKAFSTESSAKAANVAEIAENGRLSPVERLEALCDEGSLTLLRSDVVSKRMGAKARAGDGVIAGAGRVDGRPVFCYAQDPSYLGGSLGE